MAICIRLDLTKKSFDFPACMHNAILNSRVWLTFFSISSSPNVKQIMIPYNTGLEQPGSTYFPPTQTLWYIHYKRNFDYNIRYGLMENFLWLAIFSVVSG